MSSNKVRKFTILIALALFGGLLLAPGVKAGIYDAGNEVTYKEYWVNHNQFTGGCNDDGTPTNPYGSFYFEPGTLAKCPKTVSFTLPDDFSNAAKIEVYLDLWRNYTIQSATFKINDGSTIYHPPVGYDWSRTPYVMEIDKSEFKTGLNTMTFWGEKKYHVHDIGIRIYYTNDNPLVAGPGSDVTPPNGQLTGIKDDTTTVGPNAGGTLMVNNNELTLTADISADTAYVEFHAWYEGYDEDNDGVFRDWHNLGRNNWWPGGQDPRDTGGVINHAGTVKPKAGATTATVKWNVAHITNQPIIKFKIRVVDLAGNVREAPGGESANFKLMRSGPANSFILHDFVDTSLHMDGSRPDSVEYRFTMPISVADFTDAYLVGAYWRSPNLQLNGNDAGSVSAPDWSLGIKKFNKSLLITGVNRLIYLWAGGTGQFIERPGPMFVLSRPSAIADTAAPIVSKQIPLPNATGVDVKSSISANLGDLLYGVDWTTVEMRVNGEDVTNKAKLQGTMGDYRLVYRPQSGNLAFSTEYNVEIEACDMVGNCMQTVAYKFTTAAPDTTPPAISNIVIVPLPIGANVTWTTDEPATSYVQYGKTQSYEIGFLEDLPLKTSHSMEIRGLQPNTQYNLRIKGTDEQNNTGQSPNQPFKTLEFGDLLSDDFNSCVLDETIWQVVNPKGDLVRFMNGEQLELSVPAGVSHDFLNSEPFTPSVPRVMQTAANENFSVEVKFDSPLDLVGQAQGILIMEDADTYVRVNFERTATGHILFARLIKDGKQVTSKTTAFAAGVPLPSLLRVTREGDVFKWFYLDQAGVWKNAAGPQGVTMVMTPLQVGFFVGNSGAAGSQPAHKAVVDYFFNTAAPIAPEDSAPMNINLTKVGTGDVGMLPLKTPYVCGDEVILSATTIPGWSFSEWSGDVTGTAPTAAVTIDAPKYVTATFTQDQYVLNVVKENDGVGGEGNMVNQLPAQDTYLYGDVVQLTAVPLPGWRFVEWGGAASGTNPTVSLTMLQSETVIAKFEQLTYSFAVNIVNNGLGVGGTIDQLPIKGEYVYGDVINLSAEVNPGWTFGGWSGAVNSSELETQVTITGDTVVTATFDQIKYHINIETVGGGQVTRDPLKDFYLYGETVDLIADGGACWSLSAWGGDLSGSNPVEVVTITDDLNVTATFTENTYSLLVNEVGPGTVAITPPNVGEYTCGEEITLQAMPAINNYFAGWKGDEVGAENPLTFVIEKDTVITATFTDNPPPIVAPIDDKTILVAELLTFNVTATDSAGEAITLTAEDLPPGATFKDNGNGTGVFTWRPGVAQGGEYEVTFIATDGTGQGSVTVTITVRGTAIALPMIIRP